MFAARQHIGIWQRGLALTFWALMAVGHLPALSAVLWAATGGDWQPGRLALLLISEAYFVLKLADPRWLRLPNERRALLTFIVAITLLHAGVAGRLATERPADASGPWPAVLLMGGCSSLLACGVWLPALLATERCRVARARARVAWHLLCEHLRQEELPPRFALLARACAINRAPPPLR